VTGRRCDSISDVIDSSEDRRSPLDAVHRDLRAKMMPFGGWEMPLSYPTGTLAEHAGCRSAAVVFDVSHLGTVRVTGAGAFDLLQRQLTNDLRKIEPGRCQYTHLLDEADGSVLDDIIVWWVDDERFDVMPNASNTERVVDALTSTADGVTAADVTAERAVLAVQGPTARELAAAVIPEAAAVGRFRVAPFRFDGSECLAAGTGYTGEDGFEVAVPVARAAEMWRAITAMGVEPAGLGARDTLRLEAGFPLHGHELGAGITPLNAGLGWVIGWDKADFRGREALERQRAAGIDPVLVGLRTASRRPPRADQSVTRDGAQVGRVSSGNYSPTLEVGIALAFVDAALQPGDHVDILDARGTATPATVVDTPFVKH
jgi:aminomethyltransferase